MKKKFSLRTKNLIGNVICGAFWFIAGVFEHWDNTMSKIIVVVALSCAVATSVFELWLRSVEGDEMSEYHYLKAKSYVFDSMILVLPLLFCFNSLYDTFSGEPFFTNVGGWLLMFIGFLRIMSGVYFARFERKGD